MKTYGESVSNGIIVSKVLKSLTKGYDYVFFISEKNILLKMKMEIDAKQHLTKDHVYPIYKLSSINSSKEKEQSFPLSQK